MDFPVLLDYRREEEPLRVRSSGDGAAAAAAWLQKVWA